MDFAVLIPPFGFFRLSIESRDDAFGLLHDDMPALPSYVEANLFESPDGPEVGDPGYLRHELDRNLHFP